MLKTWKLFGLILLIIGCQKKQFEEEVYLFPMNYQGPVVIIHSDSLSPALPYEKSVRIYKIPENGLLKTSSNLNEGMHSFDKVNYFYLQDSILGKRIPINSGRTSDERLKIYSQNFGVGGRDKIVQYSSFIISTKTNKANFTNRYNELIDSLILN